jgi:hypothetical protein
MRRVLRPDGLLLLTVRGYDEIRAQPPTSTRPQVSDHEDGRASWWRAWCWALTRTQLADFATSAGFRDVRWREAAETGFYQPILTARR